jgi:hypothetical protein
VVFGGLAAAAAQTGGDVVSMALGSLKVLGKGSGFGNPVLEPNSVDSITKKYEIVQGRIRNRQRKKLRMILDANGGVLSGSEGGDDGDYEEEVDDDDEEDEDRSLLKGTNVTFEKHLEPLPHRLGKGAGALAQRLIATPDPKRAIKYNRIAGSDEDGRFRNPLRDGIEPGCLGLVPVKDVSAEGLRKILCASDKKLKETQLKLNSRHGSHHHKSHEKYDINGQYDSYGQGGGQGGGGGGGHTVGEIDVGGSSLDEWLRMTEKASESSGGLGGRGRGYVTHDFHDSGHKFDDPIHGMKTMSINGGGVGAPNRLQSSSDDIDDAELTIVHHQTLPSQYDRNAKGKVHLKDVKEEPYDVSSAQHLEEGDIGGGGGGGGGGGSNVSNINEPSSSLVSTTGTTTTRSATTIGEFEKGGVWEPASWVRPWAKAGIRRLVDPPRRQYHAAVAVSKRHLVVCGGELGGPLNENVSEDSEFRYRVSSGVYLLDLQTSEWSQLPVSNPVRRAGHALVCVDGKLLSFGGRSAPLPATKPFPMDLLYLHYDG